jgi:glycerol-3-phosphate O-acyltransferase
MNQQIYPHIIPNMDEWPISKFYDEKEAFTKKLIQTTVSDYSVYDDDKLAEIILQAAYLEQKRVRVNHLSVDPPNEARFWRMIHKEVSAIVASETNGEKRKKLEGYIKQIISLYANEILSNFKGNTFRKMRIYLKWFFKLLLNPFIDKGSFGFWGNKASMLSRIHLYGDIPKVRGLMKRGTVVMVPTHFSNVDSPLVGYVIDMMMGIPAFTYGAGLNLFVYEAAAYFMNRLGPYKVDRRKRNSIYLGVLKNMSTLSLAGGLNTTFFPGGTRSRSGKVEDKLKLGLLSTAISAQRKLIEEKSDKKVFIVPLILSYSFVFEAGSLIDQHLRIEGKANYLKSGVRRNTIRDYLLLIRSLFSREGKYAVSVGDPMDVFGNPVNNEGKSLTADGNFMDIGFYYQSSDGKTSDNAQREKVYTAYLSEKLVDSFHRFHVVIPSYVLSFNAFHIFKNQFKDVSIYEMMGMDQALFECTSDVFNQGLNLILTELKRICDEDGVILDESLMGDSEDIVHEGLDTLGIYHSRKVLMKKNHSFITEDIRLLFYYSNHLSGYGLEKLYVNASFISDNSTTKIADS